MNLEIVDVYAAYGDYGSVGEGSLIGVFSDENKAFKAVKGRGNIDMGGVDGNVVKSKALIDKEKLYLLALPFAISIDTVVTPDPSKNGNTFEITDSYSIVISEVNSLKAIEFMRIIRRRTGCSLKHGKEFLDKIRNQGSAEIYGNSMNLSAIYSKEEAMDWKQELELNNVAKVEVK